MKSLTYCITFATLLYLAQGLPHYEPHSLPKIKLSIQPLTHPTYSLQKRSTANYGKVNQTGYLHGSGYYSEVFVGEPPQKFNVLLDTGSSDFWLMSDACSGKAPCNNHRKFKPKASKSYKRVPNASLQVRYGTGSIIAGVGHDTVRIAGIKVENQFVSDASTVSANFKDLPIDGILGLGLNKLSKTPGKKHSIVENMVHQKLIDRAVFGMYTQSAGGEVDFGGIDPSRYIGSISYAPVTNQNYWQTDLQSYTFGDHKSDSKRELIFDTGTTFLMVTADDAKNIHKQIEGAEANTDGTYNIPCNMKRRAPPLILTINKHRVSVSAEDYILIPSSKNKTMCISGISGQDIHRPNHWILGSVFLKGHYTVFDYEKNRIGFARAVTDPKLSMETYDQK